MGITFEYDQQTFHDLELLKGVNEPSVFSIFNNTLTEGGSTYLKALIKHPITDVEELQKRSRLIQHLIHHPLELTIKARQLKYIAHYVDFNVTVLKSNILDSQYHRFTEWFRPSNDYYLLKMGCENLVHVLHELSKKLPLESTPPIIKEQIATIHELTQQLGDDLLPDPKPTWQRIVKLDCLFRVTFAKKLKVLLNEIYLIDAYDAIAKTAREKSFTLPQYEQSSKPVLYAKALKHPLLAEAVPNDIAFGINENMCFLTGPNMAGKSTFLKSIGIAIYLAHLGFPVPAQEFRTSVYSGIITTINLSDNLNSGYSHFYSEVNRVKVAAQSLADGRQLFVIFDELFRGTNVKDAFEASTAIIKGFAAIENCTFFMSTHIVEIAEEIKNYSNISFKYFNSELIDEELKYSYELKKGVSSERLGMYIVKREGILDLLHSIKNTAT